MRRLPATLRLASALPRYSARWPAAATRSGPRGLLASGSASASGRSSGTSVGRCFCSAANTAEAKLKAEFFLISARRPVLLCGQYWKGIFAGQAAMTAATCLLGDSGTTPIWVGWTVASFISFQISPTMSNLVASVSNVSVFAKIGIGLLATSCLKNFLLVSFVEFQKGLQTKGLVVLSEQDKAWLSDNLGCVGGDVPDGEQVNGYAETLACEDKMLLACQAVWNDLPDSGGDGEKVVTRAMLEGAIGAATGDASRASEAALMLFSIADIDNNGEIDFLEFYRAFLLVACSFTSTNYPEKIGVDTFRHELFYESIDLNNDGTIARAELIHFIKRLMATGDIPTQVRPERPNSNIASCCMMQ